MKTRKRETKRTGRGRRRGVKYWVVAMGTMGALVAYTVGNSHAITLAYARKDSVEPKSATHLIEDQSSTQRFDIPAGSLDTVLATFQKVTGIEVVVSEEAIRGIPSPGVSGLFTAQQALKQLLAGTGLTYRFTASMRVTLEVKGPDASVEVEGPATIISSPKYTEPILDTPQTVTVIPQAVIEQQGATTLRDVLRNVSGLTITAGEGGAPAGDNLTLRGFSARNDLFVDGARDLSPQSRDPFNLEQVEVVKGPSATYTGRGATGGTINLVNKSPNLRRSFGGTLDVGTDRTKRVTGDINLPITDSLAFRLNLLAHDATTAGRGVVANERWGIAPALSWGLGKATRVDINYVKVKQNNLSDYGIPWVPATNNVLIEFRDRPAPVPRDTFYGFKSRDHEKLDSNLVTLKFGHDFNDSVSLRNQVRYGYSTRDSIATPPRFANNNSTVINREMRSWLTEDRVWDNQTDLSIRLNTGGIEHALVAGSEFIRETNIRQTRTAPNSTTTLFNPNPDDIYTGVITLSPIVGDVSANSQGFYLFDTAKLGTKWELNGGLRWDRFDAEGRTTAGLPVARVDRMLSGRFGVVFKPLPQGSVYAAYSTALNPSLEGLSYGTANTVIDPEKTYTFEAGSKWDFFNGKLLVTGAGFRVEKLNARTPGLLPGDPPQVLEGRQRVDGAEFSVNGNFTREWTILGSYTFLDSETIESNTPAEIGKELVNTPRNSLNIWTTYELPRRVTIGGGARFVGKRFGNTINTRFVDSYWTVDAMASYPINERLSLRLNLYNLTDTFYFDRLGGGHVIPGPGRAASLSTSFTF